MVELINTQVFYNLALRPILYWVSALISRFNVSIIELLGGFCFLLAESD